MTDTPNQTQIEPSAKALRIATKKYVNFRSGISESLKEALAVAYAIDLAPIIAERDRMKAALNNFEAKTRAMPLEKEASVRAVVSYNWRTICLAEIRAALEPKP